MSPPPPRKVGPVKWLGGRAAALVAIVGLALLAVVAGTSPAEAQSAPQNVSATADSWSAVTVSWTTPQNIGTGIDKYQLQYKRSSEPDNALGWKPLIAHSVGSGDRSFQFTGLSGSTSYDFQVRACVTGPCGPWAAASATTPDQPPGKVTGVSKSGRGDVTWTWNKPSGTLTGYEWQIRANSGSNWPTTGTTISGADTTSVTVPEHGGYQFRVRGITASMQGDWSDTASVLGRPGTPTGLTTLGTGKTGATFQYGIPTSNGGGALQRFFYQWRVKIDDQNAGAGWMGGHTADATIIAVGLTNLTPNTEYEFRVRAENAERNGFFTNPAATAMTNPAASTDPPGKVLNLQPNVVSSTRIDLAWDEPAAGSGGDFAWYDYDIRLAGAASPFSSGGGVSGTASFTNLHPGTAYEFRVRACKANGCASAGPWSDTASTTTFYIPPDEPRNFTATALNNDDQGTDRLTWEPPDNTGVTGYLVRRRVAGEGTWQAEITVTGTQHDFTKEANTSGQAYEYGLKATNATGDSSLLTTTVAGRPGGIGDLSATASTTAVAVALSWTAPSTGGKPLTGYRVEWRPDVSGSDWVANPASGNTTASGDGSGTISFVVDQSHGLQPDTRYDFRIRADNPDRVSFYSNTADADQATLDLGASISSPASLTEGELDGARLTVDLVGTTYASDISGPLRLTQWSINLLGLSVSSVERVSGTRAILTMAFTGDFANDQDLVLGVANELHAGTELLFAPALTITAETAAGQPTITSANGGAGIVTVNWNAVSDADGYKVQWRGLPGETFSTAAADGRELVITGRNTTTAVIRNLEPSTTYFVRVIATKRLAPDASPSLELSATTDAISSMVTSPASLHERTLNGAELTLDLFGTTYASSLDPSDFALLPQTALRQVSVASARRVSDTRAILTLSFRGNLETNVGLQVAMDASANTANAPLLAPAITLHQAPRPGRVSGVGATPGPASLTVTWRAVSNADGYELHLWHNPLDVAVHRIAGGSTTRASIDSLLGDTQYWVRVRAVSDFAAAGAYSDAATATTLPGLAIVSATDPSPLGERNLDGATLTVDLLPQAYDPWAPRLDRASWTATGVPGVTIADVRRVSDERLVVTLASDDTDFDTDRLLRLDIRGAHTSIETVTAVTNVRAVVEPPPGRVQNVRVVPGPLWMRVTWDPVPGATGYRIEWSPAAAYGSSYHKNWPWPTSYTIGALLPGTEYRARVVATKERAPDGQASAWASGRTPAFSARLVRTEPSELTEDNLHRARLTVDLTGVEWERLVEGRYYRSQLGWLNDCSEAKYYDNCYPFIVDRSVSVAGIERVSGSRAVVTLRARNVDLGGKGLWIRFPDDLHTHYYGEADYIVLQVIAPDEPEETFETAQNQRPEETESTESTEPEAEPEAETTPETPASVTISEISLSLTEGASATYTVSLTVQPSADVQVHVFATNGLSVQPGVLTFTSGNWSAQTVTVGADEDDDTLDGTAWVTHSILAAAGSGYENAPLPGVLTVSIADDDELQAEAAQQQPEPEPQPAQQQQDETEEPEPLELTDRDVLVAFYESTGGANWTNNSNWLSDQPLGQWHGVTTNAEGEVIRLELRINNLSGSLPASLGQLDALEVLSLDRNSLSGSLPAELGNLSKLTRLAMNRNQLSGSIPSELGQLSKLSIIGLARNQLSGSLPESLGGLSGLTRLALHHNAGLSGELPQGLVNSALVYLHFQESGLCAPSDAAFQTWLDGVANKNGPSCAP